MATRIWLGGAAVVLPVVPATAGGTIAAGSTFTATVNGKAVTFTATTTSAADAAAGLAAAIAASTEPEFREFVATAGGAILTLTGLDATPLAVTFAAGGSGSPSLTAGTPVAAAGPNDWSTPANWSGATVPVDGDTVIIDTPVSIFYGLNQSAIQPAALNITEGFTALATIGLPSRNANEYAEWRDQWLRIGPVTVTVNCGSGLMKIDTGTDPTTVNVLATGSGIDPGVPALLLKGANAANAVNVTGGSVGLATLAGDTGQVGTLSVLGGAVRGGPGLTLAALKQGGGTVDLAAGLSGNIDKTDGTLTVRDGNLAAVTNNDGGVFNYDGAGTITGLRTGNGGKTNLGRNPRPKTVTNCTLEAGADFIGPLAFVAYTNPILLNRCTVADVTIDLGDHITLAPAAGP